MSRKGRRARSASDSSNAYYCILHKHKNTSKICTKNGAEVRGEVELGSSMSTNDLCSVLFCVWRRIPTTQESQCILHTLKIPIQVEMSNKQPNQVRGQDWAGAVQFERLKYIYLQLDMRSPMRVGGKHESAPHKAIS